MKLKVLLVITSLCLVATLWVACMNSDSSSGEKVPELVSYNFHIRPIFSDKCFKCHGPDVSKQEAGLRLDLPEAAFAALRETKGAFAIVPGKPEESEMYKRITSTDSTYRMPTPESHLGALSAHEIAMIKKWIAQGAKYEKHWAFTRPVKERLPQTGFKTNNEIDYLEYSKLEELNL